MVSMTNYLKFAQNVILKIVVRYIERRIYKSNLFGSYSTAYIVSQIAELYDDNRGEVFEVKSPSSQKRRSFFKQLFLNGWSDNLSDRSSQGNYSFKITIILTALMINRL